MKMLWNLSIAVLVVLGSVVFTERVESAETKKIVFVAGKKSHGYGAHEHYAGCKLLAKWLNESGLPVEAVVHKDGWPRDPKAFEGADAIVVYADGGGGHPIRGHMEQVQKLMDQGIGLACIHYGVEIPKGSDGDHLKEWIGGYFETDWSVNPHWVAKYDEFPEHAISNGVKPFSINDEWYYNMRFIKGMKGVLPVLTAVPPESTLSRPDGPHSGNPHVRKMAGQPQHLAWGFEREDGGRGFGFTGGHFHWNWAHPEFRKVMLNALVWSVGLDVPEQGVKSKVPTMKDMEVNQDFEPNQNFDREKMIKTIDDWNQ